jgi:hypothetical protein
MEVGGKFQAPAVLHPGKGLPTPIKHEALWVPQSVRKPLTPASNLTYKTKPAQMS